MIIGLAGAKGSGKNTAAELIRKEFDKDFNVTEWSFAGKLKQSAIAAITGKVVSEDQAIRMCDDIKKEGTEFQLLLSGDHPEIDLMTWTGREYLQWYGTEAHREVFGEDFWTTQVLDNIPNPNMLNYGGGDITEWNSRLDLITDVRFPNEAEAIADHAGVIFRINRASVENSGDQHASEIPLPDELVWAEIDNNKNIDDLRNVLRPHVKYAIETQEL